MLDLFMVASAFLPQGPGTSTAAVVINEFNYDDGGTDDFEFVELYNRSAAPVDISGWLIRNPDGTGPLYGGGTGQDPIHTILAGTVLAPGAFYVLGQSPGILAAGVPGVSQVWAINSLENTSGGDAIELVDLASNIIDSVVYELGDSGAFGPHPIEGFGFYGDLATGNGTCAIGRLLDGFDNDNNGADFLVNSRMTPGATNLNTNALPGDENFDLLTPGATMTNWIPGFVPPVVVDPTAISALNPQPRPASPGGGNAMAWWDPSGGGNTVQLDSALVSDIVVDGYYWVEPPMTPFDPTGYTPAVPLVTPNSYNLGDGEWWAVGVRGSCESNGNPPDVGGYFNTISLGVGFRRHFATGICWAHFRTPTSSAIYLLDMGQSGPDATNPTNYTVLAGPFPITTGTWVRLRLHAQGNTINANFGGVVGCNDGQIITATTTSTGLGAVYLAYREAVLYNTNGTAGLHPPLVDSLSIHVPTTNITFLGNGSPTSVGTPQIGFNHYPVIGSIGPTTYTVTGSNMVPAGNPNQLIAGMVLGFLTVPTGFPIGGAPPTALGYVVPQSSRIGFANASGNIGFNIGIPCQLNLLGIDLTCQLVDLDLSLPFAVQIGTSRAMTSHIGL